MQVLVVALGGLGWKSLDGCERKADRGQPLVIYILMVNTVAVENPSLACRGNDVIIKINFSCMSPLRVCPFPLYVHCPYMSYVPSPYISLYLSIPLPCMSPYMSPLHVDLISLFYIYLHMSFFRVSLLFVCVSFPCMSLST